MELKGQVTISIEDFEKLKAAADQKEQAGKKLNVFREKMAQFYEIDDEMFWQKIKEIDDSEKPMTDKQIAKAVGEARKTLKIVVDMKLLKRTIQEMIDRKQYTDDDTHIDLKRATDKELDAIEICFREQEE